MKRLQTLPNQLDAYFDELEIWLDLEGVAERERMMRRRMLRSLKDAERTGEALLNLQIHDHQTGLAGRILIDFVKGARHEFPANRLKVGSPVVITDQNFETDRGISGVVSAKRKDLIQIAVEHWPEGNRFRIDLSPDESTRRRQIAAMAKAKMATGRAKQLRDIIIGTRELRRPSENNNDLVFKTQLNASQKDAVAFALASPDVAIIHGPPGTGKTTTLAELIFQAVKGGQRVLACAPSNTAVDNLLEKLVPLPIDVVRVGHPARVFSELRNYTLDEIVERDPSTKIILEMRREVSHLVKDAQKISRGKDWRRRKREYFTEAGILRGQIKSLEKSIVRNVIQSANVICTTTTIDDDLIGPDEFDMVVIDEACQATIPGTWQAILRAEKLVFAGDHQQLPPTVLSKEAISRGLQRSILEDLIEREGSSVYRRLTIQYRMHQQIMDFPNRYFYDSELGSDPSVSNHLLTDNPQITVDHLTRQPLLFIDTAGADFSEEKEEEGESKFNAKEASFVVQLIDQLRDAGVIGEQIAVIAPYSAQVRLLRDQLGNREIEVDTVDGFQGREKDVVILTMVRSNLEQEIGFLADLRRTNVAMTRARKKLIVIGDSATLSSNPFYSELFEYFEDQTSYSSIWEHLS